MSYFQEAHHFTVNQLNIHSTGSPQNRISARDVLEEHIVPGSMHDSAERCDAPKCDPETRKAVQGDIMSWITHGKGDEEPRQMMWLTSSQGRFFFSSFAASADRRSKRGFVATLAYQIANIEGYEMLGERIMAAVERDGKPVFGKRLKTQMDRLILRPCREAKRASPSVFSVPRVIIVDGLDEVSAGGSLPHGVSRDESREADEADQVEILSILCQATNDPSFPFLVFIASRPERVIRDFFLEKRHVELFLDDKFDPDTDIRLYLRCNLAEIRRRYNLASSWPSEQQIERLVKSSSGQFIYAATVVRFLRSGSLPPHLRLERILALQLEGEDFVNPFEPLDALYSHILSASPQPTLAIQWIAHLQRSKIRSQESMGETMEQITKKARLRHN
ncbi:hypothetical protein NMY22_g6175 [Coprinellus aureogranulatus]|nr:hypothetical protein NMY22_g6175 [Coprinellus aureogranulatus]